MIALNSIRARAAAAIRRLGDESGNVAVEFGLIMPVTALLLAGIIEFGTAVYGGMSLENGARAGAQFAIEQGLDTTGITDTVAGASNLDPLSLDVDPREFYECSDAYGTEVAEDTDCGAGIPLATFIEVTVTQPYTPIFPFLASLTPSEMSGMATVRVP